MRERRLLAVQSQPPARRAGVLKSSAHQPGRTDRFAVVGEGRGAGAGQLAHLGQLLAGEPARDRRHEANRDQGLLLRLLDQRSEHGGAVDHRIGVRHRQDRAVAARGGGGAARSDRLFVLAARRAQVHVRIDEGRSQHEPVSCDRLAVRLCARLRELGDDALLDDHVESRVDSFDRIEHTGAADYERARRGGSRVQDHQATSFISTGRASETGPCVSRS